MSFVSRETDDEFEMFDLTDIRSQKLCALNGHPGALMKAGWTKDTDEYFEDWTCNTCKHSWTIWPEEGA